LYRIPLLVHEVTGEILVRHMSSKPIQH